jgi:hypothetical protein
MARFLEMRGDAPGLIFGMTKSQYRVALKKRLDQLGIMPSMYSTHSFRKGGATQAAKMRIQDSVIQRHGRWKSTCFMRYTVLGRTEAGIIITSEI